MKKYFIYFIITFFISLFSSCDNILDLKPEDYYASGNFWTNEAQVEGYALGLHTDLRGSYQNMMFFLGEARGGTQKTGTSSQNNTLLNSSPIKDNTFTKDNTGISGWYGLYSNIMRINHFIDQLTDGTAFLNDNQKNYYLGQAYGLRAFYYFYLYRTFGGVPIVTDVKVLQGKVDAKNLYIPRSTAKTTLDFIKSDINKSNDYFGSQTTMKSKKGQWSTYATKMLKAEIYLWSAKVTTGDQSPASEDLRIAEEALLEIENSNTFALLDNYANVFEYSNKGNKEIIFAVRYADSEANNFMNNFSYQMNVFINVFYDKEGNLINYDVLDVKGSTFQWHEFKWGLFVSYYEKDTRKRSIFYDYYRSDGTPAGVVVRKYNGFINAQGNRSWSDDFVVYRYADVLLMMAEIKNMKGELIDNYINKIRQRAYDKDYDHSKYGYVNADFTTNELAILHERDKEFVMEGKRWFDIRRMQQTKNGEPLAFSPLANYDDPKSVIDPDKPYLLLWPIDASTLGNDPELTQTPGY